MKIIRCGRETDGFAGEITTRNEEDGEGSGEEPQAGRVGGGEERTIVRTSE